MRTQTIWCGVYMDTCEAYLLLENMHWSKHIVMLQTQVLSKHFSFLPCLKHFYVKDMKISCLRFLYALDYTLSPEIFLRKENV